MNTIIPLHDFSEQAGGQLAAGKQLGCSQPAIGKAIKRGDVYVCVDEGKVIEAFSKKTFPDIRMRNKKPRSTE